MSNIPFDPAVDLAPIPFRDDLCRLARELRDQGLVWKPHVGCFVWDPDAHIDAPSPFPGRIYFILSMARFLRIFGSVEAMVQHLVWLPTWHQAHQVARKLGVGPDLQMTAGTDLGQQGGADLIYLYRRIQDALGGKGRAKEADLLQRAMAHHLGDLADLPERLQAHLRSVYAAFIDGYLPLLRQKLDKPNDWRPQRWPVDEEIYQGMHHFFSDYQHIAQEFSRLNAGIERLRRIDPHTHPRQYGRAVDQLLHPENASGHLDGLA